MRWKDHASNEQEACMQRTALLTAIVLMGASSAAWAIETRIPPAAVPADRTQPQSRPSADFPIWKTIELVGGENSRAIREMLRRRPFALGDAADAILDQAVADGGATGAVDLVAVTAAQLGFEGESVRLAEVYARARQLGLRLCAAAVGPVLRLQYRDQRRGEFVHIAMTPLVTNRGDRVDFTAGNGGAGLLLIGGQAGPDTLVSRTTRFIFVSPERGGVYAAYDRSPDE
jgi:hypothetical protein